MEELDLNINNYDLDDILNLFNLDYNFDESDLKQAKIVTLKTHPDKSGLDAKFFLFFKKAYNLVYEIHKYRNKKFTSAEKIEYDNLKSNIEDDNGSKEILLKNVLEKKSKEEFNEWFNKIFNEVKLQDEYNDNGYGDWFTSNKDIDNIKVTNKNDFATEFNKKKNIARNNELTLHRKIVGMNNNANTYDLTRTKPTQYSSEIFSKLSYEDLKVAHTETVVPVTKADYDNHKKFNNVESLKRHRNNTNKEPISLAQSKKLLQERKNNINISNTERVFELLKKDDEMNEANKKIWANIRLLNN
jgi:hypothetical protein